MAGAVLGLGEHVGGGELRICHIIGQHEQIAWPGEQESIATRPTSNRLAMLT